MKQLAHWASHHRRLAISLIILLEVGKNWIGVHLGFRALPALPGLSIEFCLLALVLGILLIERRFIQKDQLAVMSKNARYRLKRWSAFGLFTSSFLLSLLLGNRCQFFTSNQPSYFTAQAAVSRVENEVELARSSKPGVDEHQQTRPLARRELRMERQYAKLKNRIEPIKEGKSTGFYLLMALLAFILAYAGTGLVCSLSCSNQGVVAVLVGLLVVGIFAAGVYFVIKAIRRGRTKRSRTPITN